MLKKLETLPNELVKKIDKILLDNYKKLFNKIRKKRLSKEAFHYYNNNLDYLSTSNVYDEIMEINLYTFELRYNTK